LNILSNLIDGADHSGIARTRMPSDTITRANGPFASCAVSGQTVKLRSRLTGTFPGSPVELDYTFTLADGKIAALEID
jgi:hypothetical protein